MKSFLISYKIKKRKAVPWRNASFINQKSYSTPRWFLSSTIDPVNSFSDPANSGKNFI